MSIEQVLSWNMLQAFDWLVNTPGLGFAMLVILALWIIKSVAWTIAWLVVLKREGL